MSANPTHTVLKSSGYYFKRRVPSDLVEKAGKKFWEHSLGTKDRKKAEKLARQSSLTIDALIDDLRKPSPEEILDRHSNLFSAEELAIISEIGGPKALASYINGNVGAVNLLTMGHHIRFDATPEGGWPDDSPRSYREKLNRDIACEQSLAMVGLIKRQIAVLHLIQSKLGMDSAPAKQIADSVSPTLSAVVERWKTETRPGPKTYESFRNTVRRFEELHGKIPVTEIERRHAREFADAMAKFPNSSREDVRSNDIHRALEIAAKEKLPAISRKTRDKHLSTVKALTAFATDQGYLTDDPLKSYNPTKAGKKRQHRASVSSRRPFATAELHQIVKVNCSIREQNQDDYWIPLVAMFSGLRLEEVCQLAKSDLRHEEAIWHFDINDEDGKRLKTASSRRLVPVHAELISSGLCEFAFKSPGPRIFQTLKQDGNGSYSGAYQKRFSRLLRKSAGIEDRSVTFHSFRHSFADACRNIDGKQSTPEPILLRLMGHAPSNAISAGYGHGYGLETLNEWLQKIDPLGARLTSVLRSQ